MASLLRWQVVFTYISAGQSIIIMMGYQSRFAGFTCEAELVPTLHHP